MTHRVAILDDYQRLALSLADWSPVTGRAEVVVFDRHLDEDEAAEALKEFDVICLLRERMAIPGSLLRRLPNLKFIASTGVKNRTLDLAAARELGITVSNTTRRGEAGNATAELAWGLILSLARNIPHETAAMRTGAWQTTLGTALGGKTLGLLGLGRLGGAMVPPALAFGMKVIAWSRNLTAEAAREKGAERVDKDELFRRADVVSLHLVLGPESRGIVGAREFALMQPHAFLVNTARGPLVDRDALFAALREERIGGAAFDVYDTEPLPPDDPLRTLPRTLLTPHLGYTVRERMAPFYEDTVEAIAAYFDGRPVRVVTAPAS